MFIVKHVSHFRPHPLRSHLYTYTTVVFLRSNLLLDDPRASTMATPRPRSTIAGGERAVIAMHSWNSKDGPGLVFHDLLITEACQILYQEYQDGNRALVTAQAVRNIWDHAQLNSLWNRNSEDKLKATIRTLLNHRRFKYATGLRNDWPPSVPEPPYTWFKQMHDGTAHAGQMDPPANQIPLSDMVLMVFRSNVRRTFAIRIARLLSEGRETVTSFSELDLNLLIFHLEDDDYGFDFDAQTETLFWTGNEDGHAFSINEQLPFEAALQIQYNSGAKNLKLYIVSKFKTSVITATILQAHLLTQL